MTRTLCTGAGVATNNKVSIYAGFSEHAYRLVFNFEDSYGPAHLTTVLPCGTVENEKILEAEKGKGLIAYTFPQTMTAEVAQKHKGIPFVWKRTGERLFDPREITTVTSWVGGLVSEIEQKVFNKHSSAPPRTPFC